PFPVGGQGFRAWGAREVWLPRAVALLLALALGMGGELWVRHTLHELRVLRASDPQAAAAAAERGLLFLGQGVCGFSLACAALFARCFQLGLRERRLPPSGWWSLGARRVPVGSGAGALSRCGLGLSALLAAAGVGCLVAVRHLLELLAGRLAA